MHKNLVVTNRFNTGIFHLFSLLHTNILEIEVIIIELSLSESPSRENLIWGAIGWGVARCLRTIRRKGDTLVDLKKPQVLNGPQTQARRRSRYHHLVVVISSKQKGLESPGRLAAGKPTRIRARTNSRGWSRSRSPRHRSYSKLGRPSSYLVTLLPLNCRAKLVRDHQSPTCLNLTSFSVDTVTCTRLPCGKGNRDRGPAVWWAA